MGRVRVRGETGSCWLCLSYVLDEEENIYFLKLAKLPDLSSAISGRVFLDSSSLLGLRSNILFFCLGDCPLLPAIGGMGGFPGTEPLDPSIMITGRSGLTPATSLHILHNSVSDCSEEGAEV